MLVHQHRPSFCDNSNKHIAILDFRKMDDISLILKKYLIQRISEEKKNQEVPGWVLLT